MRTLLVAVLIMLGGCASSAARPVDPGLSFRLGSPAVADGGMLPVDFTGDGSGATLPLDWSGAPPGTTSYAVIMHHVPPQGPDKWYWVLYDIPAVVKNLPRNVQGIGILGNNSVNRQIGYAPPHSKGPGPKIYVYTIYALASPPRIDLPPAQVTRDVLLDAMRDSVLATAELHVVYIRGGPSPTVDR